MAYRCGKCGKTFQKRSKKCPSCKSEGITLVAGPKKGGSCGALVGLVVMIALAGGVLWFLGFINIPGLPSPPGSRASRLKPPETNAPENKTEPSPAPTSAPVARKLAPAPGAKAPDTDSAPRNLAPPIKASDLERAKALYAKGDFAGAAKVLDGCDRAGDGDATTDARALWRKARILDAVTRKIAKSPLASATRLEQVSLQSGGQLLGEVTEVGEKLNVLMPGGITTTVAKDDVSERTPADRSALVAKLRTRLKDKEARLKADDAIGLFRLGDYCWQYALLDDAVPYLDKAVVLDDFPVVARIFGGSDADELVASWSELTGKPLPGKANAGAEVATSKPTSDTPAPETPEPATPAASSATDVVARARAKYDQGLAKYRLSFGDTAEAQAAHVAAFKLFKEARDLLNQAGDDPKLEDFRMDLQRVLEDCRKRPGL